MTEALCTKVLQCFCLFVAKSSISQILPY